MCTVTVMEPMRIRMHIPILIPNASNIYRADNTNFGRSLVQKEYTYLMYIVLRYEH